MRLSYHPDYLHDLVSGARWYEKIEPGLGGAFLDEADQAVQMIAQHPLMWRVIAKDVRRYLLKRFPYAVHYRIVGTGEQAVIRILTIKHGSRRPDRGSQRK